MMGYVILLICGILITMLAFRQGIQVGRQEKIQSFSRLELMCELEYRKEN